MKIFTYVTLIVTILVLWNSTMLIAQDNKEEKEDPVTVSCDLVSRYLWRGADLGNSPTIQPGIEYSDKGLSLGAWGAYAVNLQGYQESDFYIGYTFYKEMFTVMVTDYYFQNDLVSQNYFDYKKATTGHVYETSLTFNGTEKLPLAFFVATNVYGSDAKKINTDGTVGDIMYSTYAELTYSFDNLDVFMGANLTSVDIKKGESGFYGNYIGVVNLGITKTKEIKITKNYSLPLNISLITNPQAEKIYFVAGFSF